MPLTLPWDFLTSSGTAGRTDVLSVVGIGAGLVSALLFAVVITGSPLGLLLSYVAPLPVFIAALGWNHRAGLVATAVGAVAIALALKPVVGIAFAASAALPAWWIAYLTLLGRPDERGTVEWYPTGRVLMWICGTAALVTIGGAMAIAGDYDTYMTSMRRALGTFLSGESRNSGLPAPRLPGGMTMDDLATMLTAAVPYAAAASFVPMIAVNLWLAGKAVSLSGRLPRSWPSIPSTQMPRETVLLLGIAIAVGFLPGFIGFFGAAVCGALFSGFVLSGLAALHVLTLGKPWRTGALSGLYVLVLLALIWLMPFLALLGIADTLFNIRHRGAPPQPPFTPNT
jgi:Predicted membrane protein (DUF2232)